MDRKEHTLGCDDKDCLWHRDAFIFRKCIWEAISYMTADQQVAALRAVCEYALYGKEPDGEDPYMKGFFDAVWPMLEMDGEWQ